LGARESIPPLVPTAEVVNQFMAAETSLARKRWPPPLTEKFVTGDPVPTALVYKVWVFE
jgi:hypothetical protein